MSLIGRSGKLAALAGRTGRTANAKVKATRVQNRTRKSGIDSGIGSVTRSP
jgi:hypothetical protein